MASEITPDLFQPDYHTVETPTPPTLHEIDGKWYIQVHHGATTVQAPIGFWFLRQLLERVMIPAVLKAEDK